ncbi:MAG: sulfatase, partial [Actinomycetota bacterium]|nr:sulfatase [Actinomycetota bacterium]
MRRIIPPATLAVAAVLLAAISASAAPVRSAQATARPNIVFVMTDDQTQESLKVMARVRRDLIGRGTEFKRMMATYALCCPSRATYLTGQYSHNHGVIHNAGQFGGYTRLDHANTLPIWLHQAGYKTIHVGRYLNGYGTQNPNINEVPPGWDTWVSTVDPSTFNFRQWVMNENGNLSLKPDLNRPDEHQTDYLGRRAAEEIIRSGPSPQPFFLSLTFPAPHSGSPIDPDDPPFLRTPSPAPRHRDFFSQLRLPLTPDFNEADVFDKPQIVADRAPIDGAMFAAIQENYRQELESLLSVDDAVGSVIDALSRIGELGNTVIIYTSDNGFFHGEHRVPSEKILPYEPGIRVPMVIKGPGVPRGLKLGQLVGNIDWAPTVLEAAKASAQRRLDGTSLWRLLRDATREPGRELVLENGRGVNSVPQFRALRNNRFLYVRHDTTGEQELYDLRKDPYELNNLEDSRRYARIRGLLSRRLRALQNCRGSRCSASRPKVAMAVRELVRRGRRSRRAASTRTRPVGSCASRDVRLVLAGRERRRVELVRYFTGGRRLGVARRRPFRLDVKRSKLGDGGTLRLRARVTTFD